MSVSRSFRCFAAAVSVALAGAALLSSPLRAQLPEGYAEVVLPQNAAANSFCAIGQDLVWYDGQTLFLDSPGQARRALLSFPSPRFGSFTEDLGNGSVAFAENSFGDVWRVPLAVGGTPQLLTSIPFAYDALRLGPRLLLVSAKTGGFGAAQNDLITVDLVTGARQTIGLVAGSSGPVAKDGNGNLLYANAPLGFPPPPASVSLLRWSAAQWAFALSGGPMLTDANAQTVVSGLQAASDLAVDADDDVFAVDWLSLAILEIDDAQTAPTVSTFASFATSPLSPAGVAFARGAAGLEFEPFAHAGGGELLLVETDYFSTTRMRRIAAAEANVALVGGGAQVAPGPFALQLQGAAPQGLALFALGTVATGAPLPLRLPGFEATLLWEPGLVNPLVTNFAALDGTGSATFGLTNPGFGGGLYLHVQALFATADGRHLATSPLRSAQLL